MTRFVPAGTLLLAAALLFAPVVGAQGAPSRNAGRLSATRAELDSLAMHADEAATSAGDAETRDEKQRESAALRARLRDGDFQVGDRVVLFLRGDSVLSDTFTVERGRTLALPDIPTVALNGVLRSELQSHLAKQLGPYGITVNAVSPGTTLTPRAKRNRDGASIERIKSHAPLRPLVEPEDTAAAVLFLTSNAARRITGGNLNVTAGAMIL